MYLQLETLARRQEEQQDQQRRFMQQMQQPATIQQQQQPPTKQAPPPTEHHQPHQSDQHQRKMEHPVYNEFLEPHPYYLPHVPPPAVLHDGPLGPVHGLPEQIYTSDAQVILISIIICIALYL